MTIGTDLLASLTRRLGEQGLTLETGREDDLYAFLTEARDEVQQDLAVAAPFAFQSTVTLEQTSTDPPRWALPTASADPLRLLALRDADNLRELEPSAELNQDAGEYQLLTPRSVQLADFVTLEGDPEFVYVPLSVEPIDALIDDRADLGLPAACDRAIVYKAAVLSVATSAISSRAVRMAAP